MSRYATVYFIALGLAAAAAASPPAPPPPPLGASIGGMDDAVLERLDSDLAGLETPDARARRILAARDEVLGNHEIFVRLSEAPSEIARKFLRSVLTDHEVGWGRNADCRQQAARVLGQIGLPVDAALLKRVAAEDPTTHAQSSGIAFEANAREAASLALVKLAERYPEASEAGSWLR